MTVIPNALPMSMTLQWAGPVATGQMVYLRIDGVEHPFEVVGVSKSEEYPNGHVAEVRAIKRLKRGTVDALRNMVEVLSRDAVDP